MIHPAFPKWLLVLPVAAVPAALLHPAASAALALGFLGSLAFFRDPEREPEGPGFVSPADGVVDRVEAVEGGTVVSIFMRLRDVHVNRAPVEGEVRGVEYVEGEFRPAFRDASRNERNRVFVETGEGEVRLEQVAGAFARRIRCFVEPGDALGRGERFGLIAFSSRVTLVAPVEKGRVAVSEGDTVKAGETVLIRRPD